MSKKSDEPTLARARRAYDDLCKRFQSLLDAGDFDGATKALNDESATICDFYIADVKSEVHGSPDRAVALAALAAARLSVGHATRTSKLSAGRRKQLEARVAALERQMAGVHERGLRYRGVHQRADAYRTGDCVTAKGGLWICLRATSDAPGESADWQLAVKG